MSLIMDVLSKTKERSESAKSGSSAYPVNSKSQFQAQKYFHPESTVENRPAVTALKDWIAALRSSGLGITILTFFSLLLIGLFIFSLSRPRILSQAKGYEAMKTKPAAKTIGIGVKKEGGIEGIVLDGKDPYCLIAGRILKTGDYWQEKKIIEITREGVLLQDLEGKATFMKLQK